jgi:hypothetical protein
MLFSIVRLTIKHRNETKLNTNKMQHLQDSYDQSFGDQLICDQIFRENERIPQPQPPCYKCYMCYTFPCDCERLRMRDSNLRDLKEHFEHLDASIAFMKNTLAQISYQIDRLMVDVCGNTIKRDNIDIHTLTEYIQRLNENIIGKVHVDHNDKLKWVLSQIQRLNMEIYGYDNTDAIDKHREQMRRKPVAKPKDDAEDVVILKTFAEDKYTCEKLVQDGFLTDDDEDEFRMPEDLRYVSISPNNY